MIAATKSTKDAKPKRQYKRPEKARRKTPLQFPSFPYKELVPDPFGLEPA